MNKPHHYVNQSEKTMMHKHACSPLHRPLCAPSMPAIASIEPVLQSQPIEITASKHTCACSPLHRPLCALSTLVESSVAPLLHPVLPLLQLPQLLLLQPEVQPAAKSGQGGERVAKGGERVLCMQQTSSTKSHSLCCQQQQLVTMCVLAATSLDNN